MSEIIPSLLSQCSPILLKAFQALFNVWTVWLGALLISIIIGTVIGIFQSKRYKIPVLSSLISGYVYIGNSMSDYVQVLIAYLIIPELLGQEFSFYIAEAIALCLCVTAYVIDLVKTAIDNFPAEKIEPYKEMGYSYSKILCLIIMPQVFKMTVPSFLTQAESLLTYYTALSVIDFFKDTKAAQSFGSVNITLPIGMGIAITMLYILLSLILLSFVQNFTRRFTLIR